MVFSSLYEFEKWHKSIQRRYNSVEDRALQRKQAALNRLHGPPRPHSPRQPGVTKTGAECPPFARCDIQGPRHHTRELKDRLPRHKITINGMRKRISHHIWWLNTKHWPTEDEVIHHIDGDSLNDSFENLQLMSHAEHSALHNSGKTHPNFGKPHSEETKAKISASVKKQWQSRKKKHQPSEKPRGDAPSPRQWGDEKDQRKGRGMNSNACEVGLSEQTRDAAIPRLSQPMARRGVSLLSINGLRSSEPTPDKEAA